MPRALILLLALIAFSEPRLLQAGQKMITASAGWVKLPVDGDSTSAFLTIENPTMYDAYLVSASSDVAGTIVFRKGLEAAAVEVKDLVVPAFGSLEMTPAAGYLWLSKLKRTLSENESVELQLTMDGNVSLPVKATVRK